jgi:hypothetical protein
MARADEDCEQMPNQRIDQFLAFIEETVLAEKAREVVVKDDRTLHEFFAWWFDLCNRKRGWRK